MTPSARPEAPGSPAARRPPARGAAAPRLRPRRAALDPARRARGAARHLRRRARAGLGHRSRPDRGPRDRGGARSRSASPSRRGTSAATCASTGQARIEGTADGRIVYSIDGAAGSTFLRNRIGFCVLHPAAECAGVPLHGRDGGGRDGAPLASRASSRRTSRSSTCARSRTSRRRASSPRCGWRATPSRWRTSATGPTPRSRPTARRWRCRTRSRCAEGTRLQQSVTLRLLGAKQESVDEAVASVPGAREAAQRHRARGRARRRGAARSRCPRSASAEPGWSSLARRGGPGAARGWGSRTCGPTCTSRRTPGRRRSSGRRATRGCSSCRSSWRSSCRNEPEPALAALAARAAALAAPVGSWLLFRAHGPDDTRGRRGRGAPGVCRRWRRRRRFGGGTDRYFTELNRGRPSLAGLDRVELLAQPAGARLRRPDAVREPRDPALAGRDGAQLRRRRADRDLAGHAAAPQRPAPARLAPAGERPFTDDPRQQARDRGRLDPRPARRGRAGRRREPHAVRARRPSRPDGRGPTLPRLPRAGRRRQRCRAPAVLAARSQRPERIQVLALQAGGRGRVFLANISADPHPVRLDGLPGVARCAPLGAIEPGEVCELEHELAPHSVLRLDVEAEG